MEIQKANIKWSRPLSPLRLDNIDSIALHHMAHTDADIERIHSWHLAEGWKGFAYNYWIDKQGNIFEGRGLNEGAAVEYHNSHIISVGFQGDYDQVDKSMPEAQFNSGVWLVRKLIKDIPSIRTVHGHKHWNNTSCPGRYFPLMEMVEGIFTEGDIIMLTKIKEFQRRNGLAVDGIVGPATKAEAQKQLDIVNYILSYGNKPETILSAYKRVSITGRTDYPTLRRGNKGQDVVTLQEQLRDIGYYTEAIDGDFGPATEKAVKLLQEVNGLAVDGIVGPATWNNILIAHVYEVDPMCLKNEIVKLPGNQIQGDFINSVFFNPDMTSSSYMINDGKLLNKQWVVNPYTGKLHDNVKRGNLIVYQDGSVAIKMIMDMEKEEDISKIKFAVTGFNLDPLNLSAEWWPADVARTTWRSMLGYDGKKIKAVIMANCSAERGNKVLDKLGCNLRLGLDSGGSTCGRFAGVTIHTTARRIYGIIRFD